MATMSEMMSTREVAAYLRVKERKIYDLLRKGSIPCTRVTGKWLFPKHLIDQWVAQHSGFASGKDAGVIPPATAVAAGSHDPLLEWALREIRSEFALLTGGSLDGLQKFSLGEANVCGLHVFDDATQTYNVALVQQEFPSDVVLIEWAWREQGLMLAPGNPLGITGLADLLSKKARVAQRQNEAGSQILLMHLLAKANISPRDLMLLSPPARSESDIGLWVLEGKADAGLGVSAAARQLRLGFLPLHRERFDLLVRRRDYFEPPFQKLLAFTHTEAFMARARELGGYDMSGLGRVVYNAA